MATVYTEATNGHIYGLDAVYANARNTANNHSVGAGAFNVGQLIAGVFFDWRGFLGFDTSGLGLGVVVTGVTLTMTLKTDTSTTDFNLMIVEYNWASPIVAGNREANYDGALAAAGGSNDVLWRNTNGIAVDTPYTSAALRPTWINRTGMTYLALLSQESIDASEPPDSEYAALYAVAEATQAWRPYLTIATAPPPRYYYEHLARAS